jgi:hypothetical protein
MRFDGVDIGIALKLGRVVIGGICDDVEGLGWNSAEEKPIVSVHG